MQQVAVRFKTPNCRKCNTDITQYIYLHSDRKYLKEGTAIDITNREPELELDPVRFHVADFERQQKEGKDTDSKFILSLAYPQRIDKVMTSSAISVVLDENIGPETVEDEHNLRRIFSVLHVPLFNMNKALFKGVQFYSRMTAAEFEEYAIYEDPSLILKLLFAFGTGKIKLDIDEIRTSKESKSQFMACAIAKEMLQRINLARPGPFQIMMAQLLETMNSDHEHREYFSSVRLAASVTYNSKKAAELQADAYKDYKPDPFSMETRPFDNVGFKGRKKKWSQHCIIQRREISEKQLREDGYYQGGRISRLRTSFRDFAQREAGIDLRFVAEEENEHVDAVTALAEKVVAPTDADKTILSRRVLESIQCAIDLDLPDVDICAKLQGQTTIYWNTEIPLNLGTTIEAHQPSQPYSRPMTKENKAKCTGMAGESKAQLSFAQPTMYETNNMTLEKPWHKDPNSTETVEELMKYVEETSEWDRKLDLTKTGGEPPLRDHFVVATCDGAPMKRFLVIMDKDIRENGEDSESRKFKKVRFFMGGLHFQMEFANMSNRLARDYLSYFVQDWRPTEPQLNWLLCVSDPTDYVLEMPQFIMAHYRAAADGLRAKDPDEPLTAGRVHQHMLERAKEYPVCMAMLLTLRFVEIALMIRDSEKSGEFGDVDLFLATIRLALPVFTASHAVNYVHICCEFLEWWELASDAEKLFFRKYLYTQKSPLGKPIWADRAVEWTMRHLRIFLGRYARPNQNQRVEKVVAEVPFRMSSKRDLRALSWRESNLDMYSSKAFNMQTVKLSNVYVETYLKAVHANFWGSGTLEGTFYDPEFSEGVRDEPVFEFPVDGEMERMSTSYLDAYLIGEERIRNYYIEWHIKHRNSETRDGVNVDLKLIPSQFSTRNDELSITNIIRLSTDPDELEPLKRQFPIEKIKEDLDALRGSHYPEIPEKCKSRKEWVAELCKWKKKYFEDFPWVETELRELAERREYEDNETTFDSRGEQLEHFIFSLDQATVDSFSNI